MTSYCVWYTADRTWGQSLLLRGGGSYQLWGSSELPGGLIGHQENQQKPTSSAIILIRTITRWSLGQYGGRPAMYLKYIEAEQLVQLGPAGIYRKQESNHLEWPDHTFSQTLLSSACIKSQDATIKEMKKIWVSPRVLFLKISSQYGRN